MWHKSSRIPAVYSKRPRYSVTSQHAAKHCNTLQHSEIPEMYSKRPWRPICVGIERVREKQKSVRVGFNGLSAEDVRPNASCPCVTWLMHICDMTHAYVWPDSCIFVTCHMYICDMTFAYWWHDSCCVTRMIESCHASERVIWRIKKAFQKITWSAESPIATAPHRKVKHIDGKVEYIDDSRHTHECVTSNTCPSTLWKRTHTHTLQKLDRQDIDRRERHEDRYERNKSHAHVWHPALVPVTWLIRVTWLMHMCDIPPRTPLGVFGVSELMAMAMGWVW